MGFADLIPRHLDDMKNVKVGEVARWLQVSTNTIHRWSEEGRLPRLTQLGTRTFVFRTKELRAALKALDQQTAGAGKGAGS